MYILIFFFLAICLFYVALHLTISVVKCIIYTYSFIFVLGEKNHVYVNTCISHTFYNQNQKNLCTQLEK